MPSPQRAQRRLESHPATLGIQAAAAVIGAVLALLALAQARKKGRR